MEVVSVRRLGVTVMEMLIVIAIAGILLGIGVVRVQPPESRLFANDVKAQIEQARYEAIRRNGPVAVVWEAGPERFATRLDPNDPTVGSTCNGPLVLQSRALSDYRSVELISGASGAWSGGVVWLPSGQGRTCNGGPAIGGTITITDGRTTHVVEVSVGGRVSIQ